MRLARSIAFVGSLAGFAVGAVDCGGAITTPQDPLVRARRAAESSTDGEIVGRWLLAELFAPGGEPTQAIAARKALDAIAPRATGLYASVARGVDDEAHGRLAASVDALIEAIGAAQKYEGPEAPLLGRYATGMLIALRGSVPHLWEKAKATVEDAIAHPSHIGAGAHAELVALAADEEHAAGSKAPVDQALATGLGCVGTARFAGPFGRNAPRDRMQHFDAENPGPWPVVFAKDPSRLSAPSTSVATASGCRISAEETEGGVYYVETFVTLDQDRDAIVTIEGATGISIDDTEVLTANPEHWGEWPHGSVHVALSAGRHRLLGRLLSPATSVRLSDAQGLALPLTASSDPAPGYVLVPPKLEEDLSPTAPFEPSLGIARTPAPPARSASFAQVDIDDPVLRVFASSVVHEDGRDDVASVMLEPVVKDAARATGLSLAFAASFADNDPIFAENDARDVALDLRTRAAKKDALLWYPRLWLALDEARKSNVTDILPKLQELSTQFADVPQIIVGLATIYSRLGWSAERSTAIFEAASRFPDDVDILRAELELFDERGRADDADKVIDRLRVLDARGFIDVERAIRRRDFDGAIKGLEAAKAEHPEDKAILARIQDLLLRAGRAPETFDALEKALRDDPKNSGKRLALADAKYARGDRSALHVALVDAIQLGAPTDSLRDAVELVEGTNELSAYRIDGLKTIRDYEAARKTAPPSNSAGNAVRVLDYMSLWVHSDGSARALEHEILYMQSHEAVEEHGEPRMPRGDILHLRTVKADGTIYEPEIISGKDTVTMPHLDVGDYIETETIYSLPGNGSNGQSFVSDRWFFREPKIDYYRSEFVVISPKEKTLDFEITGDVPAPTLTESGPFVVRRYRVDQNPAVPEERFSTPIEEFLPSLRFGWGVKADDILSKYVDLAYARTPRDPRLEQIATTILANGLKGDEANAELKRLSVDDKARRIYRWVSSNVVDGDETDPRRVVTGKSGSQVEAFIYLSRLVGVDVERGLVRNKLEAPPIGPISEVEVSTRNFAIAVPTKQKDEYEWMIVGQKYAPYGFLPAPLRGQPAILLVDGTPHLTTQVGAATEEESASADVKLAQDGSATLELDESFGGAMGIGFRSLLEKTPDARMRKLIEAKVLGAQIPGARLKDMTVKDADDLDAALTLHMSVEVSSFATPKGGGLRLAPPFAEHLGGLVALPSRQTPLFISVGDSVDHHAVLRIKLPPHATVTLPAPAALSTPALSYKINDRVEGDVLILDRVISMPPGRVQPADYPAFAKAINDLDEALEREIQIGL